MTEAERIAWNLFAEENTPEEKALAADIQRAIDEAVRAFWKALHEEAEAHYDRRAELLGPIQTEDDAAERKILRDGWSAWLLAKRILDSRRNYSEIPNNSPSPERGPEVTKPSALCPYCGKPGQLYQVDRYYECECGGDWHETETVEGEPERGLGVGE